jgi:hypothetical protein
LPQITDFVIIDGTTQPGLSDRLMIKLDGSNVSVDNLYISAGNIAILNESEIFYPTPTLPLARGGSKKFTNDLGLL